MKQETKKREEPTLERIEVISPSPEELMVYAAEGWQLYAIKEERYFFNRWRL